MGLMTVLLSLMLALGASALDEAPLGDAPGIPPGQEDLLLSMLGKGVKLPDGCSLGDSRVEYDVVEATYACRFGEVVVELIHSGHGAPDAIQTEFFAIAVLEGSASEDLTKALQARIQSREADFEWVETGGDLAPED